jgi:hypothetical protein
MPANILSGARQTRVGSIGLAELRVSIELNDPSIESRETEIRPRRSEGQ